MTKEEVKAMNPVPRILHQYGVEVKRGRCKAICHDGNNYTAKVSHDLYFCFKCNLSMDVFDITMHFNHCDFRTAFELLGGTEKPSFSAQIKANKAIREREERVAREERKKAEIRRIGTLARAYQGLIESEEPFSDLWCHCQNKLPYQLYLFDLQLEKR